MKRLLLILLTILLSLDHRMHRLCQKKQMTHIIKLSKKLN